MKKKITESGYWNFNLKALLVNIACLKLIFPQA